MISTLFTVVGNWVVHIISTLGYPGIVLCMTIESALIPLPSEIIMPFSGYLVSLGRFNLLGITIAGTVGNLLGSLIAYSIGYYTSEPIIRRFIRKFGKFILLSEHELDVSEKMFKEKGEIIAFASRLLPGIRTVISLPAGIAKMPLGRFVLYTVLGSAFWSFLLGYVGKALGDHWNSLKDYFHKFDAIILALLVLLVIVYVYKKLAKSKSTKAAAIKE